MNSFDNKKFSERVKKLEMLLLFPMKSLSFMSAHAFYTHEKKRSHGDGNLRSQFS